MLRHHAPPASRTFALPATLVLLSGLLCAAAAQTDGEVYIGRNTTLRGKQTDHICIGWLDEKHYNSDTGRVSPTVRVVEGAVISNDITVQNASTLNISGGVVRGSIVSFHESSVRISGGTIKGGVDVKNTASMTISGGSIKDIEASHHSVIFVRGGHILGGMMLYDYTTLHIYGTGLKDARRSKHPGAHDVSGRQAHAPASDPDKLRNTIDIHPVSGTLADGTPFDKRIKASRTATIVLHNAPAAK